MTETAAERLRMHLAQAKTRAENDDARAHVSAALTILDEDVPPTPLDECPVCGRVGLPEQLYAHRCPGGRR